MSIDLKRSEGETGRAIFLRNSSLHLRFMPAAFSPLPEEKREFSAEEVISKDIPLAVDFQDLDSILPQSDTEIPHPKRQTNTQAD